MAARKKAKSKQREAPAPAAGVVRFAPPASTGPIFGDMPFTVGEALLELHNVVRRCVEDGELEIASTAQQGLLKIMIEIAKAEHAVRTAGALGAGGSPGQGLALRPDERAELEAMALRLQGQQGGADE